MMTLYAYINANIDRIRHEVRLGLMPCAVLRHWEIYSRYDALKKMGFNVCEAVLTAAADARMSESSIYKIIKRMETEV
jgi:Mor family transcriptional regulator